MPKRSRSASSRIANLGSHIKKKQRDRNKENEPVPLQTMRRFATRAHRFMDAYRKGLSGKQAAWAAKKYRGHRVLPNTILDELSKIYVLPLIPI